MKGLVAMKKANNKANDKAKEKEKLIKGVLEEARKLGYLENKKK